MPIVAVVPIHVRPGHSALRARSCGHYLDDPSARSAYRERSFSLPNVRSGAQSTPTSVGDVRSVSGEFHEEPWVELVGWGRGVQVRSAADLDVVHRFINDRGTFRRAVIFENLTARRKRELATAIEDLGVELREFADRDKAAMATRTTGVKDRMLVWGSLVVASPFLVARRLQGRTTTILEISRPASPPTEGT